MPDCAKVPPHRARPYPPVDLSLAFPTALRPAVTALTTSAAWNPGHNVGTFEVMLCGEQVWIPNRVYFFQRVLWGIGDERTALDNGIAWCIGTRHHSGYVREGCLRHLLSAPQAWMAPFVVQLIGEYVVEIVQPIAAALAAPDPRLRAALAGFVRENPRHLDTIERRVISYWSYYYRGQYPDRACYPGALAVARLRAMAQEQAHSD